MDQNQSSSSFKQHVVHLAVVHIDSGFHVLKAVMALPPLKISPQIRIFWHSFFNKRISISWSQKAYSVLIEHAFDYSLEVTIVNKASSSQMHLVIKMPLG